MSSISSTWYFFSKPLLPFLSNSQTRKMIHKHPLAIPLLYTLPRGWQLWKFVKKQGIKLGFHKPFCSHTHKPCLCSRFFFLSFPLNSLSIPYNVSTFQFSIVENGSLGGALFSKSRSVRTILFFIEGLGIDSEILLENWIKK